MLLLVALMSANTVLGVPPRSKEQCSLPAAWEDVWRQAGDESQVRLCSFDFLE